MRKNNEKKFFKKNFKKKEKKKEKKKMGFLNFKLENLQGM